MNRPQLALILLVLACALGRPQPGHEVSGLDGTPQLENSWKTTDFVDQKARVKRHLSPSELRRLEARRAEVRRMRDDLFLLRHG